MQVYQFRREESGKIKEGIMKKILCIYLRKNGMLVSRVSGKTRINTISVHGRALPLFLKIREDSAICYPLKV